LSLCYNPAALEKGPWASQTDLLGHQLFRVPADRDKYST
jgi:hypothetical protein